jgi:hypothetical protein
MTQPKLKLQDTGRPEAVFSVQPPSDSLPSTCRNNQAINEAFRLTASNR